MRQLESPRAVEGYKLSKTPKVLIELIQGNPIGPLRVWLKE